RLGDVVRRFDPQVVEDNLAVGVGAAAGVADADGLAQEGGADVPAQLQLVVDVFLHEHVEGGQVDRRHLADVAAPDVAQPAIDDGDLDFAALHGIQSRLGAAALDHSEVDVVFLGGGDEVLRGQVVVGPGEAAGRHRQLVGRRLHSASEHQTQDQQQDE